MKKLFALFVAIAAVVVLSGSTQAALEVRGLGTIVSGGSGDYQLIYDTLLDITWLDYNRAPNGWSNQTAWAAGLEVSFDGRTFDNWRLPQTLPVNGSTYNYGWQSDGSSDEASNISAPGTLYAGSTGSEMAHLYYCSLGNLGFYDFDGNEQPGWGLQNTGPFNNLQAGFYWSGTEYAPYPSRAWLFSFDFGYQVSGDYCNGCGNYRALAVLSGDVSTVPIPGAVWLLGSGLAGLAGFRRKFKKA